MFSALFVNFAFMEEPLLNFDFGEVVSRGAKVRRRSKTIPRGDVTLSSRQLRIDKRNRTLVARYYYWTEIRRRRFDDVMRILSDYEFFVEDRTISNTLVEYDELYTDLMKNRYSGKKLSELFPGFDFS